MRSPPSSAELAQALIGCARQDPALIQREGMAMPALASEEIEELVSLAVVSAQQAADALREARHANLVAQRSLVALGIVLLVSAAVGTAGLMQFRSSEQLTAQLNHAVAELHRLQTGVTELAARAVPAADPAPVQQDRASPAEPAQAAEAAPARPVHVTRRRTEHEARSRAQGSSFFGFLREAIPRSRARQPERLPDMALSGDG